MNFIRNLFTFFLIFCFSAFSTKVRSQTYVTIPDTNFVAYLHTWLPSAMNGNQLDTSSTAVTTFTTMGISNLNIKDLTGLQYFHSLKTFGCTGNPLTWLPPIPDSIINFSCSQGQLTSLPSLPKNLIYLKCDRNNLTNLPQLPSTLKQILCQQNSLTALPNLPSTLTDLQADDNYVLASLPDLPKSLRSLSCSNNQLTSLPTLPDSLQFLDCHLNKITCFPIFPNTLTHIFIFKNSFTCLPNYIAAMNGATLSNPPLPTYPLCNVDNPGSCPVSKDAPTEIIIPNMFTPNDDGINDLFFIRGSNLTNFSCSIFNRWGLIIYEYSDINGGWNGKNNNSEKCDDGVYYYQITYTDNTQKPNNKNGFLQLMR
jgi:gliding motility-associated-like protein